MHILLLHHLVGVLFQLFLGRGGDFQELGHCPLLSLLTVTWNSMAPLGVSFSLLTEDQGLIEFLSAI